MLFELILTPLFMFFGALIDFIPSSAFSENMDLSYLIDAMGNAFVVFPYDLFIMIVGNAVFWFEVQFIWAVVEWVYKKIPGVN